MGKKAVNRYFYNISIVFTLVICIICLSGTIACYFSPHQNIVLPFIALALPIVLLTSGLLLIYWTIRWRLWAIAALLAVVANYGYLSRIFRFAGNNEPITTEKSFIIGTYNVNSFNQETTGYYCKSVANFMKSQNVDVLCMQEFWMSKEFNQDSTIVAFNNWPYHSIPVPPDDKPILNVAIFSKYPILNTQLITHPDSKNCSMICDLDINGTIIRVFSNHLQTTDVYRTGPKVRKEIDDKDISGFEKAAITLAEELKINYLKRSNQADEMADLIAQSVGPTIVCGDFNSPPSSYCYRTMLGRLKDGFKECGKGYMYTYRYFKHLLRIDYIFVSEDLKGLKYYSPKPDYSDHNPVIMEVAY